MKKITAILLLIALALAACTSKDAPHSTYTYQSIYSQSPPNIIPEATPNGPGPSVAIPASKEAVPLPMIDAAPILGGSLPSFPSECVLNLVPPVSGLSMRDTLNIQGAAVVICAAMPTMLWVGIRLQMRNSDKTWSDENVLVDPHWPEPRTIDGKLYYVRHYEVWATCFPGWWRVLVSWNGLKHSPTGVPPEPFGTNEVSATPLPTNCTT